MRLVLSFLLSLMMSSVLSSAALQLGRYAVSSLTRIPLAARLSKFPQTYVPAARLTIAYMSPALGKRVFCIPTYDGSFGHMMTDAMVRKHFIESFVPGAEVISSEVLGTAFNPVHSYGEIEKQSHYLERLLELIANAGKVDLLLEGASVAADLRKALMTLTTSKEDLLYPLRNSKIDIVCEVEYVDKNQGHVLVEVQVSPLKDYSLDARALYYEAGVFARQLRRRDDYGSLKNVVCINILGGESCKGDVSDWRGHFAKREVRHYRFVDARGHQIIPGIELIQYPVFLLQDNPNVNQDWIKLLTSAHDQDEEILDDKSLPLPIHRAYELLDKRKLPLSFETLYKLERDCRNRSSEEVATKVAEGKARGLAEGEARGKAEERAKAHQTKLESAHGLLVAGTSPELVANSLKLPLDEVMRMFETQS